MIAQIIHNIWKNLPRVARRRIIRMTQERFTVSAAAVITKGNEVLLLEHVLRPRSGWGLPGGFLEKGEQPKDGIVREIREELGIGLDSLVLFRVRTVASHIEFIFSATAAGEPKIVSPREITRMLWAAADSLPDSLPQSQRAVIEAVLNDRV